MIKNCSKCGKPFTCNANDITNCHCSAYQLTEEQLSTLRNVYMDCLCPDCLKELTKPKDAN